MGAHLDARVRMLERFGRDVTLQKIVDGSDPVEYDEVTVTGFTRYMPADQLVGEMFQRQGILETLDDVFTEESFGLVSEGQELVIDSQVCVVVYARPLYEQDVRIGWSVVFRGGHA